MCRWSAQLWAMVLLCGAMDDGGGDSRSWCSNMSNMRSSSSMSSSSMSSSIVSRSTAINISTSHGCGRHVSRVGSSTPTQHSQVPRSRCSNMSSHDWSDGLYGSVYCNNSGSNNHTSNIYTCSNAARASCAAATEAAGAPPFPPIITPKRGLCPTTQAAAALIAATTTTTTTTVADTGCVGGH